MKLYKIVNNLYLDDGNKIYHLIKPEIRINRMEKDATIIDGSFIFPIKDVHTVTDENGVLLGSNFDELLIALKNIFTTYDFIQT